MSLVKPSVSQKNREIRRKPRSYFPKSSFSFISRNPSHFPKSLNSRIRSSPTRGIHVFGKAFGFTKKNGKYAVCPDIISPNPSFSLFPETPTLLSQIAYFPKSATFTGASWFRSRNELYCCAAGAKKIGVLQPRKEETLDF